MVHESSAEWRGGHRLLICNTGHCSRHAAQKRDESLLKDVEEAFKFHMAVLARLLGRKRPSMLP